MSDEESLDNLYRVLRQTPLAQVEDYVVEALGGGYNNNNMADMEYGRMVQEDFDRLQEVLVKHNWTLLEFLAKTRIGFSE